MLELGRLLQAAAYRFTCVTPETHRRVNARETGRPARDLRDVFGWSRPFAPDLLPKPMWALLEAADLLEPVGELWRSRVRYSSLGGQLFVHSAFPTVQPDAVFFGPDTYRFAALIERALSARQQSFHHVVDIGCGTGAGGLFALSLLAGRCAPQLTLADINPQALLYARVNAALAGQAGIHCVASDVLLSVQDPVDLVLSNPPYLVDPQARLYRDGGGSYGCDLSVRIVRDSLERLAPGGVLILYTGTVIVDGVDIFLRDIFPILQQDGLCYQYKEIDPDVFGEELEHPAYAQVERIAVVSLVIQKSGSLHD